MQPSAGSRLQPLMSWKVSQSAEAIRAIVLEDSPCLLHGLWSLTGSDLILWNFSSPSASSLDLTTLRPPPRATHGAVSGRKAADVKPAVSWRCGTGLSLGECV